jgi:hypothetical protein
LIRGNKTELGVGFGLLPTIVPAVVGVYRGGAALSAGYSQSRRAEADLERGRDGNEIAAQEQRQALELVVRPQVQQAQRQPEALAVPQPVQQQAGVERGRTLLRSLSVEALQGTRPQQVQAQGPPSVRASQQARFR